jgi:hypothetical protein
MLFSGKAEDLANNWVKAGSNDPAQWPVADGAMTVKGGSIATKESFTDFVLHVEFKEPDMPNARGQAKGNSGVFLQGLYEIQVLDSYGISDPGRGDCGAVYNQAAPLFNACKPPLEWQTYDIIFRSARFDANGAVVQKPRVTVLQNGIVIQNNVEIQGGTAGNINQIATKGPIILQDHGNAVQYRNVWILPLPLEGANHY